MVVGGGQQNISLKQEAKPGKKIANRGLSVQFSAVLLGDALR